MTRPSPQEAFAAVERMAELLARDEIPQHIGQFQADSQTLSTYLAGATAKEQRLFGEGLDKAAQRFLDLCEQRTAEPNRKKPVPAAGFGFARGR